MEIVSTTAKKCVFFFADNPLNFLSLEVRYGGEFTYVRNGSKPFGADLILAQLLAHVISVLKFKMYTIMIYQFYKYLFYEFPLN